MQNHWTKDDVAAAWQRFERTYAHDPVAYRFLCGHCIQDETDEDALDYNIIGVWLVCHRKYRDWSTEKSYDLAWILEFMQAYHMTIPRYIKRTKFYRKKMKLMMWFWIRVSLNQRIFGNSAENADLRWHMSALTRYCFSWIPMTER